MKGIIGFIKERVGYLALCLVLLFFVVSVRAQVYPVQVTTQLIPPASPYLSDYTKMDQEKLIVNLLMTDIQVSHRQVKLKLRIEGNGLRITTHDYASLPALYLNGGEPLRLTGHDLKEYFRVENLHFSGGNPQVLARALPEGMYRFCFEVFDFQTNQRLSLQSCGNAVLRLNDPPVLNLPERGKEIKEQDFQNIIFQWTPRHFGGGNIEYEFTMVEVWDKMVDPQAIFLAGTPLYQATTVPTMLHYGPSQPQLLPGKRYAWRVQAKQGEGVPQRTFFKNEGNSEIFYFDYLTECDAPSFVLAEPRGSSGAIVKWQENVKHTRYEVEYRKKGKKNAVWFTQATYGNEAELYDLEPATTYEFRVGGDCTGGTITYSQAQEFTTAGEEEERNFSCGMKPDINIANRTPLDALAEGELIKAMDFPVRITEVSGSNGTFSGKGYLTTPYLDLVKIAVTFTGVKINTDRQLIDGFMQTAYNSEWSNTVDLDQVGADLGVGEDNPIYNIEFPVDSVKVEDGRVVVVGPNGEERTFPTNKEMTITGTPNADGTPSKSYTVSKDGAIEEVTLDEGGGVTAENTEGGGKKNEIASDGNLQTNSEGISLSKDSGIEVTFSNIGSQYAFDLPTAEKAKLRKQEVLEGGYVVPYKYVPSGSGTDKVRAVVRINDESYGNTPIVFKDKNGVVQTSRKVGSDYEVTLKGHSDGYIYATLAATDSTQQKTVGMLKQVVFEKRSLKVLLVPVNGASLEGLASEAQQIYAKVGVVLDLQPTESLRVSSLMSNGVEFEAGDSNFMSDYTDDMKEVIRSYSGSGLRQPTQDIPYVVFVMPAGLKVSEGITGSMPMGRTYGFLFEQSSRTLAHELAHGVFHLPHTFSEKNDYPEGKEGSTDNLMDYGTGTALYPYQWNKIFHAKFKLQLFSDEEEGLLVDEYHDAAFSRLIKTINCANYIGEKEVRLYLPAAQIETKVSNLVSIFHLAGSSCSKDAKVRAAFYKKLYGQVSGLGGDDYFEDVFSLEDIEYNDKNKTIKLKGNKYNLLISGEKTSEIGDALCAYHFVKSKLSGPLWKYRGDINEKSLDDLQYASPCELQQLSIERRKKLLQELQLQTNWYNDALKDSRQKIIINVIATTPKEQKKDLLVFFNDKKDLLKNLYDRIDDYRGEFIEEINAIYQVNKDVLNDREVVAIGIRPGVTLEKKHWLHEFSFFWGTLDLKREHISAEYISSEEISVNLEKYTGPKFAIPGLFAKGTKLCEGDPFDVVQGMDQLNNKVVEIPLICFLYESEEADREVLYDDALSFGKFGVDAALTYFGIRNLKGASALLKAEVTGQNVVRLLLSFGDLGTLGLGEVCKDGTSDFCQAYKQYEIYINMGFLSASVLNEFPQIYRNLRKGLDDPTLTEKQKEGLRKVLGEADDLTAHLKRIPGVNTSQANRLISRLENTQSLSKAQQGNLLQKILDLEDTKSINRFLDDFAESPDLFRFADEPGLVKAWEKMHKLGADDALRKNVGALDALSKPKGMRPDPSTYLDQKYIDEHLAKFDEGIVRFTTETNIEKYKTLGGNEAFAMSKKEYNQLFEETAGNLAEIEKRLGLNPGDLTSNEAVIAWIKKEDLGAIKIPTGNEKGVIDEFWIPGGKTSGGVSEVVVDLSNMNLQYIKL